ncbi:carbohydrate ABC transporter permease [Lacisediminihabitans changchengi]|uniref:carbohydrate ABC transporter permease n=1 Tax=Lacisediminihabitans changchengi TaxID=2787634 RepID=UPI0027DB512A|nr:sugar ABC transporter permease [Lacisediminihabitans changchengi]
MTQLTESVVDSPATTAITLDHPPKRRGILSQAYPWLYLVVPLALLITFTYVPAVNLFYYSVTSWDGLSPEKDLVGLANYVKIFTEPKYLSVFAVSLYYIAASFLQMILALYFATVLSFNTRFRSFFKGVIFFPYLINGVAVAFTFLFFFQPGGTLDSVLDLLGVHGDKPQWLGNPALVNISFACISVWRYMGLNFVLFLGSIQSIPSDLYEAAALDGASRWQQFRYIIAPGIKRIISLSFILAIAGSLAVFEIPYIMLGGSNGSATFVIQTVRTFNLGNVGLASALAVVLLLIVLITTVIQRRIVPDEDVDLS